MDVKTYLPLFSGFYETSWAFDYDYIDNFINEDRKELGLVSDADFNDLNIDHSGYEKDIVQMVCDSLPDFLPDYITKIELEELLHPKEYNYYNDSANVTISINTENVKNFIYQHKEKFSEFLKKRYTSYDGFMSHYENDFASWEENTKGFTDFTCDGHRIGSILEFIAMIQDVSEYDIFETIWEKIDYLEYVENLDDVINKQDGSLFEFLTSKGVTSEYADYLNTAYINKVIKDLPLNECILSFINEYENILINS